MKTYIIYDSYFGNTQQVASAMAKIMPSAELSNANTRELYYMEPNDLIILGCPTRAFSYTPNIRAFMKKHAELLQGVRVACFDTRLDVNKSNSKLLHFLAKHCGYAAEKMERKLVKLGAVVVKPATWFFVQDSQGPLVPHELDRAENWAKSITL